MKKLLLPCLVLLVCSISVFSQNISATTEDGKKVILKPNKTWEYAQNPAKGKSTDFSFETGIIYQSGEVVPVARTKFYILDSDVVGLVKDAGIKPTKISASVYNDLSEALESDISHALGGKYANLPEYVSFRQQVFEVLKAHIIAETTTDFTGKGKFTSLPKQKCFLFGVGATRKSSVMWNLEIDLTSQTEIVLDQNNAAVAY